MPRQNSLTLREVRLRVTQEGFRTRELVVVTTLLDAEYPADETQISTVTWCDTLLAAIAVHTVGDRLDRFEPRVKKRCPQPYRKMTKPRQDYKKRAA